MAAKQLEASKSEVQMGGVADQTPTVVEHPTVELHSASGDVE